MNLPVPCENAYEPEDMAHCPVYGGHICSLCCSLMCVVKINAAPKATIHQQIHTLPASVSSDELLHKLVQPHQSVL